MIEGCGRAYVEGFFNALFFGVERLSSIGCCPYQIFTIIKRHRWKFIVNLRNLWEKVDFVQCINLTVDDVYIALCVIEIYPHYHGLLKNKYEYNPPHIFSETYNTSHLHK